MIILRQKEFTGIRDVKKASKMIYKKRIKDMLAGKPENVVLRKSYKKAVDSARGPKTLRAKEATDKLTQKLDAYLDKVSRPFYRKHLIGG